MSNLLFWVVKKCMFFFLLQISEFFSHKHSVNLFFENSFKSALKLRGYFTFEQIVNLLSEDSMFCFQLTSATVDCKTSCSSLEQLLIANTFG